MPKNITSFARERDAGFRVLPIYCSLCTGPRSARIFRSNYVINTIFIQKCAPRWKRALPPPKASSELKKKIKKKINCGLSVSSICFLCGDKYFSTSWVSRYKAQRFAHNKGVIRGPNYSNFIKSATVMIAARPSFVRRSPSQVRENHTINRIRFIRREYRLWAYLPIKYVNGDVRE